MENKFEKAIKEIANILGVELSKEETKSEVKLSEMKLADGTVILLDGDLAEGTNVLVQTPDGDVPAPDGDHTLEDGTTISTEGGVIKAITPKAETEEVVPADEMPVEQSNEIVERINSLENSLAEIKSQLNNQVEVQEKIQKVLQSLEQTTISEPVTRTETVKNSTQEQPNFINKHFTGSEAKQLQTIFKAIKK